MSYFFMECPNRVKEISTDKGFLKSLMDYRSGSLGINESNIEFEKSEREFQLIEGFTDEEMDNINRDGFPHQQVGKSNREGF